MYNQPVSPIITDGTESLTLTKESARKRRKLWRTNGEIHSLERKRKLNKILGSLNPPNERRQMWWDFIIRAGWEGC